MYTPPVFEIGCIICFIPDESSCLLITPEFDDLARASPEAVIGFVSLGLGLLLLLFRDENLIILLRFEVRKVVSGILRNPLDYDPRVGRDSLVIVGKPCSGPSTTLVCMFFEQEELIALPLLANLDFSLPDPL